MSVDDVRGAGVSLLETREAHETVPLDRGRVAVVYPVAPPRHDPGRVTDDVARSWLVIAWLLVLVPPLGMLALDRRHELSLAFRIAVGVLATVFVVAVWVEALSPHLWH